jgi:predicted branched-subunit amino acid permease
MLATPTHPHLRQTRQRRVLRGWFARGFVAMLPLWAGAIPSGIAYGVAAQTAGLGIGETQLMSILIFSSAAQISVVALLGEGAPFLLLLGTVLALNAQLPLLGLAIGKQLRPSWPQRLLTAFFLTDGAFGIAAALGRLRLPAVLGAGVSMFAGWNLGTILGVALGRALPDPRRLGLDFVITLTFLAVLVPLVRTRTTLLVALVAGIATILLVRVVPSGVAVLGAGLAGCLAGALASRES